LANLSEEVMSCFSQISKSAVLRLAIVGTMGCIGQPAFAWGDWNNLADRDILCQWYADDAQADVHTNIENGCGYSGPAWGDTRDGHYTWCMQEPDRAWVEKEDTERHERAHKCDLCGTFARDAVNVYNDFKARGCLPSDIQTATTVNPDYGVQLNSCLGMGGWPESFIWDQMATNKRAADQCAVYARWISRRTWSKQNAGIKSQSLVPDARSSGNDQDAANDARKAAIQAIPTRLPALDQPTDAVENGAKAVITSAAEKDVIEDHARAAVVAKDVVEDGAKAAVVGVVAAKAAHKVVDYGAEHEAEIRRAADTAKYKLKQGLSEIIVHRPMPTKIGDGGLRSKLSHVAEVAKVGILRRLIRH
jgi:hypothetical protein